MYKVVFVLVLGMVAVGQVYAQQPQIATFQETAQVIIDRTISGNVTSSVTLQTTSNQEIKVPQELIQDILNNPEIVSVVLTNQDGCGVLGVMNQNCILVNVMRGAQDTNIIKVQETAKKYGDKIIDETNKLFDTDAVYHSSYLHHKDEINRMLETSGVISGRDIVSAVYTMSKEETQSMYQKISAMTVAKEIRDAGGFYDTAYLLASEKNSNMVFSIIPIQNGLLYQIKVSVEYTGAKDTDKFNPLEYLKTDKIHRSEYFAGGFYPLNSILQIVVLSPHQVDIRNVNTNMIPTMEVDGETIPTELEQNGWVFEKGEGTKIEGKYLFGTKTSVGGDELVLDIGSANDSQIGSEESIFIITIITMFGVVAIMFYLKGYR